MVRNLNIRAWYNRAKDSNSIALVAAWFLLLPLGCAQAPSHATAEDVQPVKAEVLHPVKTEKEIAVGARQFKKYLPLLEGKRVAIIANQTSVIDGTHLVDTLLALGVDIKKVLAPEHGFRGTADAGEDVNDQSDPKTGLPIVSIYGEANKKPKPEMLADIDIVLFDIQDVGVRFYTYIYTMSYAMEACAENDKAFLVLDRPNPNGFYIDGPILKPKYASFIGKHEVPVVHGMTVGEYAQMVNGEGWLKNSVSCNLQVIPCANYDHNDLYQVPIKPSPNLPNMASIYLYPSVGLFEGTVVSVGRGTPTPFQVIGHPDLQNTNYTFTPQSVPGAKYPPHLKEECKGFDLRKFDRAFFTERKGLYLNWLIGAYADTPDKKKFFLSNDFINLLAGTDQLKQDVINGKKPEDIRASWKPELQAYKQMRKQYLLYPDFE